MGLDITSSDRKGVLIFHGAYSAFYRFRDAVSKLICSGGIAKTAVNMNAYAAFMDHSDCEGKWTWQECRDIDSLVRPKLHTLSPGQDLGGHLGDLKEVLTIFLDGLQHCAHKKVAASFH